MSFSVAISASDAMQSIMPLNKIEYSRFEEEQ